MLHPANFLARNKLVYFVKNLNEAVHFVPGIVEVEAGAERGGDAKLFVQWLVAMMPHAHGHSALVEHRGNVEGVGVREDKADETGAVLLRAKDTDAWKFSKARSTAFGEF